MKFRAALRLKELVIVAKILRVTQILIRAVIPARWIGLWDPHPVVAGLIAPAIANPNHKLREGVGLVVKPTVGECQDLGVELGKPMRIRREVKLPCLEHRHRRAEPGDLVSLTRYDPAQFKLMPA